MSEAEERITDAELEVMGALKREDVGELRAMFDALWEEKGGGET